METRLTVQRRTFLFAVLAAAATPAAAAGYTASRWQEAGGARVRLILPNQAQGPGTGAIEIVLPPDAKTYWRTPGDTGVPTLADFSGSTGIRDAELLFPAPVAFDDGIGGFAYGYHDNVILPFRFVADAASRVSVLLSFGICTKNLCLPAQATLSLSPSDGAEQPALASSVQRAIAAVPQPVAFRAEAPASIRAAQWKPGATPAVLMVEAKLPPGTTKPALFAEGDVTLTTRLKKLESDVAEFAVRFESNDPVPRGAIVLTLVTGATAIETKLDLDALEKRP